MGMPVLYIERMVVGVQLVVGANDREILEIQVWGGIAPGDTWFQTRIDLESMLNTMCEGGKG
jgi:hypothetical protein